VPCKVKQSPRVSDTVVSVLDGDTIKVLHNSRPERIRLSGIDCPEKDQAYGKRVKGFAEIAQAIATIEAAHVEQPSAPTKKAA
jgi:endonuclease YncB( thermonuclease family)